MRLNLAPLVKQLPEAARAARLMVGGVQHPKDQNQDLHLLWLCSTAGHAAVNTHDNACAILWALDKWPYHLKRGFKETGKQSHTHCNAHPGQSPWLVVGMVSGVK